MSYENSVVLVAGGAGAVGEGIVRAFLQRGGTVVVPSRSEERLAALRQRLGALAGPRFVGLEGHVGRVDGAEAVRRELTERFGRLDAVVASLGGWRLGGPLVGVSPDEWSTTLDQNLTVHWIAARTFIPALGGVGSYTMLNGLGSEIVVPEAGPVSIAAAGLRMMKRVLADELRRSGSGTRLNDLVLGPVATRLRHDAPPGWVDADDVGALVADLAASTLAGETLRLPDRAALAAERERVDLVPPTAAGSRPHFKGPRLQAAVR